MLFQFIVSMLSAVGFALVFQVPKKALLVSSLNAGVGWIIYKIVIYYTGSNYMGTFFSAFVISLISEICAKLFRHPSLIFIVPGVINLCPGEAIYDTMKNFVNNQFQNVILLLFKTVALAGAIAFGIILSSVFSSNMKNFKLRKTKRTNYLKIYKRRKK
ncbi:threonine/serine exporter family protein [Anaerococcus sp. AGMB09787]|uniref:threonine/serine exporter family protein n=1 Tax=Anaerococcus sp. AGMB09787 TaxID=2922869 RepID=UPI001FAF5171|nr:threonine/serine exporter family protein [Anaerococcus sp. AGMB09787]